MSKAEMEHEPGWFYGYAPMETLDENGKVKIVDSRNVVGRFRDHSVIDIPASRAAHKSVFKTGILLETRILRSGSGLDSKDVSSQIIRFDPDYIVTTETALERFPAAWAAYQKVRRAEITEDEIAAIGTLSPGAEQAMQAKPKPKRETIKRKPAIQKRRGRPPKAKATVEVENVVKLQTGT